MFETDLHLPAHALYTKTHSSVESSVPNILRPRVQIPSTGTKVSSKTYFLIFSSDVAVVRVSCSVLENVVCSARVFNFFLSAKTTRTTMPTYKMMIPIKGNTNQAKIE